jgi:hypothetical protein
MGIRAEFEQLVSMRQGKAQDLYDYTLLLIEETDKFIGTDDEKFNKLSNEAKLYLNDAVIRYNKREPLPALPLEPSQISPEKEKSLIPVEAVSAEPKLKLSTADVRKVICQNTSFSLDNIKQKLIDQGIDFKASTLNTLYTDTRSTIKVLSVMGKLKIDLEIKLEDKKTKTGLLREIICSHEDFKVSQIKQEAQKQNLDCPDSTISVVYSDTKATLKILRSLNLVE